MAYRIVKRAWGQYETAQDGIATWLGAMNAAEVMQNARRDGEYFVRADGEPDRIVSDHHCPVQAAFAYL